MLHVYINVCLSVCVIVFCGKIRNKLISIVFSTSTTYYNAIKFGNFYFYGQEYFQISKNTFPN